MPLEKLFYLNDVPIKPSINLKPSEVEDRNLGTEENLNL